MFGLSRRARSEKQLKSALRLFLPGDAAAQARILQQDPEGTKAAVDDVTTGVIPYRSAAFLVASYIRTTLDEMSEDDRRMLLRLISEGHTQKPPKRLALAVHMTTALARLEGGDKPLVDAGTTSTFLDMIAAAFSEQQGIKNKIAGFIFKSATDPAPADDES